MSEARIKMLAKGYSALAHGYLHVDFDSVVSLHFCV